MNLHILNKKEKIINQNFDLAKHLNSSLKATKFTNKQNSIGVLYRDSNRIQPAVSKTWRDNVYSFNKSYLKTIPMKNINASNLLKYYFGLYNRRLEKKLFRGRKRHITRFRRISSNRILISKIESGITSNNVLLNIFAFNPEKYFLLKHLAIAQLKMKRKRLIIKREKIKLKQKINFSKKINLIKSLFYTKGNMKLLNQNLVAKYLFAKIRRRIKRIIYRYLLFVNQSKFNSVFASNLIPLLERIYNKKINLNIIDLKYLHLNSEITSKFFTMKLRKREVSVGRLARKLKAYLTRKILPFVRQTKKVNINRPLYLLNTNKKIIIVNPNNNVSLNDNYFSNMLMDIYSTKNRSFLKNINFKYVRGIMFKISGRLTKRFTASRAVRTVFNKGAIKNMYSQRKNMSSTLTKGYLAPSIQYTKTNYKTRVGAFGVKGWLGGV